MERIGLFVDVQNIYYTTRHTYGRQFDYRTLWNVLARGGAIEVAKRGAANKSGLYFGESPLTVWPLLLLICKTS